MSGTNSSGPSLSTNVKAITVSSGVVTCPGMLAYDLLSPSGYETFNHIDTVISDSEMEREASSQDATQEKPKPSNKEILHIDAAISKDTKQPEGLDGTSAPAPAPSALATARVIEDLGCVQYPEGINRPRAELNVNAPAGKFRYDRDFLMQFMSICKEKPDNLPPLDAIGLVPGNQNFNMSGGGSGRRQTARQTSVGLGSLPASLNRFGGGAFAAMDNFSTEEVCKLSSEKRFPMASESRSALMGSLADQGGPGKERNRIRSKCGEKRSDSSFASMGDLSGISNQAMSSTDLPLEPVTPLEMSANSWVATSTKRATPMDQESCEVVGRKVKALLNKLTMKRFDSISDQIIQWANKSEKDGRTLLHVTGLILKHATDGELFCEMYARLCRKMMIMISQKVQIDGIRNSQGQPITGGLLFRSYLLSRCQKLERGWIEKVATAVAAFIKTAEERATKDMSAGTEGKEGEEGEGELFSDKYYAAQKVKRRGLALIRFIGELFKLQTFPERTMHQYISELLSNVDKPEEEKTESLCKFLTSVGQILDTQKAHAQMDVYFSHVKELLKSGNVNSRIQFMLQNVIELRARNWVPCNQAASPTTTAQIHKAAVKEKAAAKRESYQRHMSVSRGGSRRGSNPEEQLVGPVDSTVAASITRSPPKAGDLSNFGKIGKSAPMTFGPSSVFAGKKEAKAGPSGRETPISRTASTSNMFSMLSGHAEAPTEGKPSRPPSRKPSVDLGQAGVPEAPQQRRKLQLLPRSKPVETKDDSAVGSEPASSEAGEEEAPVMSEADALKKIDEDTKTFFSLRSLDEAENYFSTLPQEHRFRLVDKLAMQAVESKEADAQLVADLFTRAREKNLATPAAFEEGLMPLAEIIDDVAIDAPKALDFFAIMMKGAGLHEDEECRARIAAKSMDSNKLLALLAVGAHVGHDVQFTKQIGRDVKEFFELRLVSEAETYFVNLPPMHRPHLVRKLTERARTSSLDASLVSSLFQSVQQKGLCSQALFEFGMGLLEEADIVNDAFTHLQ